MTGKIDTKALDERGFVVMRGLLDKQVIADFETEIAEFCAAQLAKRGVKPEPGEEPMITLFKLGGRYRHMLFDMLQSLTALSYLKVSLFDQFKDGGALAPLGFRLPVSTVGLRVDLPLEVQHEEPWHQDYSSACLRAYHAWVPLRRVDQHYGTMRVIPGTHKRGFVQHDMSNPRRPFIPGHMFEGLPSETVEAEPGDAVIFNSLLFHRSETNRSNRIKFIVGYMMQDLASMEDPEDPKSPIWDMFEMTRRRFELNQARANAAA
jgi:hypothetical protein